MNAPAFTPGPWVAIHDPLGLPSDWMVGTVDGAPDGIAVCEEANARLIASAPELYGALRAVLPFAREIVNERHPAMQAARAALAKAVP